MMLRVLYPYDCCMKGGLIVKSTKKYKVLMGVECFDLGVLSDQD